MLITHVGDTGRLVRQRREDLHLSQSVLAERAGMTRQLLSRFEQGKSDPPISTVLRLLRELDLTTDVRTRADRATTVEIRVENPVRPRLEIANGLAEILSRSTAQQRAALQAISDRLAQHARD